MVAHIVFLGGLGDSVVGFFCVDDVSLVTSEGEASSFCRWFIRIASFFLCPFSRFFSFFRKDFLLPDFDLTKLSKFVFSRTHGALIDTIWLCQRENFCKSWIPIL